MPGKKIDFDAFRVSGRRFKLADVATCADGGLDKGEAQQLHDRNVGRLQQLQERLYAENRRSLLVVLQAMDTAGKDSTIRKVVGAINPQGCLVTSFKKPTDTELAHDFLWRVHQHAPRAGHIGVFNRSHYEDVLVARVRKLSPKREIEARYAHINAFEKLLADRGTRIVKIMLNVSSDYQLERLRRRLERPDKHWKFNPADLAERALWDEYMAAYELALRRCSTDHAPWYVIPAEKRWYRNAVISGLLVSVLEEMNPRYPPPAFDPADYPPESLV